MAVRTKWDIDNDTTGLTWLPYQNITSILLYAAENHVGKEPTLTIRYSVPADPVRPVADFTANPRTGNGPLSVIFADTSSNSPTSWSWAYKNATVGWTQFATTQNPSFVFASGTYDVNLTATNVGGSDDEIKTAFITVSGAISAPVTGFTANMTSGSSPLAVGFTDSSLNTPANWDWYWYPNETKSSDLQNPVTVLTTGLYNVRLYTSNSAGGDWENKTSYITVSSGVVAPVTGFTANMTSGSSPLAVRFTDSSTNTPANWDWYWYPNETKSSDLQNPVTVLTTGLYNVRLYTSNSAGGDWENKTSYITVSSGVVAPVTGFTANMTSGTHRLLSDLPIPVRILLQTGTGTGTRMRQSHPISRTRLLS